MTVSFYTEIDGKKTHFPEKILKCIEDHKLSTEPLNWGLASTHHSPKLHTIRRDEKDRLEEGVLIDFFINARTKKMFRFAPRIPIVSTQEVFMTRRMSVLEISIAKSDSYIGGDDRELSLGEICIMALNDGFDGYQDFHNYFSNLIEENGKVTGNYWYKGKIIHWTNLKY